MTTDEEQAAIKAVIDKAVAAGMDRGRLIWAAEAAINLPLIRLPGASTLDTGRKFTMTIEYETLGASLPAGTTSEQMQAAEDYVRGRMRRYWGLE